MDASDRIRRIQGRTVLRDFKTQLEKQPTVNPAECESYNSATVRYNTFEYRELVRNGLADTACNNCTTDACAQQPYKGSAAYNPEIIE